MRRLQGLAALLLLLGIVAGAPVGLITVGAGARPAADRGVGPSAHTT